MKSLNDAIINICLAACNDMERGIKYKDWNEIRDGIEVIRTELNSIHNTVKESKQNEQRSNNTN